MKKFFKRFLLAGLFAAVFALAFSAFTGCSDAEQKYDVSIKVVNNYGQEWIFTPDIDELYYVFEYTGEEMTFGVESYNLPDHPEWGDEWLSVSGAIEGSFLSNLGYVNQRYDEEDPESVCDKGEYFFHVEMNSSDLWDYRSVILYITVK